MSEVKSPQTNSLVERFLDATTKTWSTDGDQVRAVLTEVKAEKLEDAFEQELKSKSGKSVEEIISAEDLSVSDKERYEDIYLKRDSFGNNHALQYFSDGIKHWITGLGRFLGKALDPKAALDHVLDFVKKDPLKAAGILAALGGVILVGLMFPVIGAGLAVFGATVGAGRFGSQLVKALTNQDKKVKAEALIEAGSSSMDLLLEAMPVVGISSELGTLKEAAKNAGKLGLKSALFSSKKALEAGANSAKTLEAGSDPAIAASKSPEASGTLPSNEKAQIADKASKGENSSVSAPKPISKLSTDIDEIKRLRSENPQALAQKLLEENRLVGQIQAKRTNQNGESYVNQYMRLIDKETGEMILHRTQPLSMEVKAGKKLKEQELRFRTAEVLNHDFDHHSFLLPGQSYAESKHFSTSGGEELVIRAANHWQNIVPEKHKNYLTTLQDTGVTMDGSPHNKKLMVTGDAYADLAKNPEFVKDLVKARESFWQSFDDSKDWQIPHDGDEIMYARSFTPEATRELIEANKKTMEEMRLLISETMPEEMILAKDEFNVKHAGIYQAQDLEAIFDETLRQATISHDLAKDKNFWDIWEEVPEAA